MSEDKTEYKIIKAEVGGMLDDTATAVAEVTRLPASINGRGCTVSGVGLKLHDGLRWTQFSGLIRYMDSLAYGHSVRDCLFRFLIGDALNGGESQFGEKYSQVMDSLHWSQEYITNIQWVCRNIPEVNRDIKITNWKFWTIIAPLDTIEQAHWVSEAKEAIKIGGDWCIEIKKRIGAAKMASELEMIEDEKLREQIKEVAEHNDGVTWCNVRNWRKSRKVPEKQKTAAQWWTDTLDELDLGEKREEVLAVAMAFVEEVKNRRIKPDGKARLWNV